eukprot:357645-Chlamydomonas_euryale.AAC.8
MPNAGPNQTPSTTKADLKQTQQSSKADAKQVKGRAQAGQRQTQLRSKGRPKAGQRKIPNTRTTTHLARTRQQRQPSSRPFPPATRRPAPQGRHLGRPGARQTRRTESGGRPQCRKGALRGWHTSVGIDGNQRTPTVQKGRAAGFAHKRGNRWQPADAHSAEGARCGVGTQAWE